MAALGVKVQEAPTLMDKCSYHVFLSFRGKDTRKTFTDHLHTAMMCAGFRTFRDDDELEIGEDIELGLDKAIQESKVSVIIFSKDYASSRWCLDELLKILERKNTVGHIILPVFYHVHPSEVRNQTGSFATAFMRHEEHLNEIGERKKEGMAKIKRWKAGLREVADLEGEVLEDRHESKFVQHIVGVIGRKLNRIALNIPKYQISLDTRIKDINFWFQDESDDGQNCIMMIYGMAGIGKTTIAKTIYNLHFERFHGSSSFLADVRETAGKPNGLVSLQKQLISSILKGRKVKIDCVDEGITMIRDLIHHKRVLVVLDDVDDMDQLHALGIRQDWFHPGSKVMITTRCEQLLKTHKLYKVHKVEKLCEYESLILFSLHAFEQQYPKEGYLELSERVVHYCGGVPLALEVLGSSLFGRNVDVWESTLRKLEVIPNSIILRKLKISYDSLEDDHDKSLFLDIACFFVGKSKQYVSTILAGCDFYTELGIQNLVDRCLLTIDEHNKLIMHQILQDMGREIVREESPSDLGKRSRLWCAKESIDVLTEKTGTETIEGLALNWTDEDKPAKSFFIVKNSKRRNSGDFAEKWKLVDGNDAVKRRRLSLFSWLPINHALSESSSTLSDVIIRTDMFARMHKLRLLQLSNIQLRGAVEEFPKKLRWLYWRGSTLKYIPSAFPMESLVALDMRYSSLEQFWKGTKVLEFLKILNLSHSQRLTITPDFLQIPNLERLILKSCINLSEVHESIGDLGRLVLLNLRDCKILRKLPRRICLLKQLEELILSGCSRLDELPTGLCTMKSLKMLHADGTAIAQATSAPTEVKPWSFVFWSSIPKPRRIPKPTNFSLASLSRSLTNLSLANCNLSDSAIPEDFGSLSMLHKLNVSTNPFCSLPESIKGLSSLQSLRLNDCTRLQSLPELPTTLTELVLDNCWSLERVTNLPNLLRSLDLGNCECYKLVEVQGLFKLEPLGNTDAELINCLRLFNLESLQNVKVDLYDVFSTTYRKVILQGLFECSIFSTFIPASEVPDWFSTKSVGPLISMKMPPLPLPNLRVLGFNICILYNVIDADDVGIMGLSQLYIRVSNKTKNLKWFYSPTFIGRPGIDEGMLWLSYWKIGNQFEVGDEVDILVLEKFFFEVKEVGFDLVYDEEEGTSYKNVDPACSQNNSRGIDLSEYEVKRGSFFLCHHNHKFHKLCSSDDRWTSSRRYKNFFGDE